jgi:hypothetical protein
MRTLLAAIAAALVLAAAAAADPLDPKQVLNPRDDAYAARVVLNAADLNQGWQGGAIEPPSSLKAPVCPQLRPNFSKLTLTGHAESRFDNAFGMQVSADVEVWKTAKQMNTHYKRMLRPKIADCIGYALLKDVGGTNVTILETKRLSAPWLAKLAPVTRHFRTPLIVKSGSQRFSVLSDIIFLGKGRTQVYLNFIAPGSRERPLKALQARVARVILARVAG